MKNSLIAFLLIWPLLSYSQSNDVLAMAAFLKAQEVYANGDYKSAITRLNEVKELLGDTNPRVEYLLAQSHFQSRDPENAQNALSTYFDLASQQDPNFNTMLLMIEDINSLKENISKEAPERATWEVTLRLNTRQGYENYLGQYPTGLFDQEAKNKLKSLPPSPLKDLRDGQSYKTVKIGNQIWMAEDLRFVMDGVKPNKADKPGYGHYYSFDSLQKACPSGWHLPSYDEVIELISFIGFDKSLKRWEKSLLKQESINDPSMIESLKSKTDWKNPGTNSSGFNALPSYSKKEMAFYWMKEAVGGWWYIQGHKYFGFEFTKNPKGWGRQTCRCIKDE